jgi:predicted Zn-dependent peptidase
MAILKSASKLLSFNGIDIWNINEDKFKTGSINIFFQDNLIIKNVSYNAILPAVLKRGCVPYPSFKDIALKLEDMYGAVFDCDVEKKGEQQIIQFNIEFIKEMYTDDKEDIYRKALDLVYRIITEPVTEGDAFKRDYTNLEKENMKKRIQSRVNDKMQYAVERCIENMCSEEPFGIYEYGSVSGLMNIDESALYNYYKQFLKTQPVKIFITGNYEDKHFEYAKEIFSRVERNNVKDVGTGNIMIDIKDVKNITERMNINQSKLSMGFRTYTLPSEDSYYDMLVCSGILGGGIHSKLFQNVREKESLAYYIFSRLEKFKGLMIVSSGIDEKNKDKTVEIILKQIEDIQNGIITDYEFDSTIKSIETSIDSLKDSQLHLVDFYLSQDIMGTTDTLDTILGKIKNVKRENVIEAAKKIKLDTVYLLAPGNERMM